MIFYYLDASAWVKRYYQETGTAWVEGLFSQNQAMACSSLGFIEVAATLARKRKAGEVADDQFLQKVSELEEDWSRFIQIQFTSEAVALAVSTAVTLALRGADAVHLASAILLHRRFSSNEDILIFVTSDLELKHSAQVAGLQVVDPEEQELEATQ